MPDVIQLIQQAMSADMKRLNSISQNLANVNTDGYKREIAVQKSFEQHMVNHNGQPVTPTTTKRDMSLGALRYTGSLHNVALTSQSFLKIQHMNGEAYTRRGELQLANDGKLVLSTGETILGQNGPIYLEAAPFSVSGDGSIYQDEQLMGRFDIVDAQDSEQLKYLGKGVFTSGSPLPKAEGELLVKQGYLETSNVESLREMVELINTTRHFESSSQVLKGYDSMMDSAINVLGDF